MTVRFNHPWLPWLLGFLFLMQFLLPSPVWLLPLITLSVILVASWWWAQELRQGVRLDRTFQAPWIQVGDRLEQSFDVTNASALPLLWGEIEDLAPDTEDVRRVVSVGSGSYYRWRQEMIFWHRGHYRFGPLRLRTADPFGLFSIEITLPEQHEVVVHPPVLDVRLPPRAIPKGSAAGQARGAIRSIQRTNNASGVRPWMVGDPLSHVHWPTTARLGSPHVKDFEREPSGDLWLVLDLDARHHVGHGPESTLEYAVTLAASLAAGALAEGRAVGLAAWGAAPWRIAPARGSGHMPTLLRVLAELQAAEDRPWGAVLAQLSGSLGVGLGALLITPNTTSEWLPAVLALRRRGISPTALLLDAPTFDPATPFPHALPLRQTLADLGVAAEVVTHGILPPVERRQRYDTFVTGTGRVVRRERGEQAGASPRAPVTLA